MRVWTKAVMICDSLRRSGPMASPLSDHTALPVHDLGDPALPLTHEELALGTAVGVPAQWTEDGLDGVGAQPVRELGLVVIGPDGGHGGGDDLSGGESVRGIFRRCAA